MCHLQKLSLSVLSTSVRIHILQTLHYFLLFSSLFGIMYFNSSDEFSAGVNLKQVINSRLSLRWKLAQFRPLAGQCNFRCMIQNGGWLREGTPGKSGTSLSIWKACLRKLWKTPATGPILFLRWVSRLFRLHLVCAELGQQTARLKIPWQGVSSRHWQLPSCIGVQFPTGAKPSSAMKLKAKPWIN